MATMQDVATLAHVSLSTVSYAINNTRPISAATRERIERAMVELDFRPNAIARSLASRRSRIIALTFPGIENGLGSTVMEFVTSAAEAARARGYHLVVWPYAPSQAEEMREMSRDGLTDGVIIMEVRRDDPRVRVLDAAGIPLTMIGRADDTRRQSLCGHRFRCNDRGRGRASGLPRTPADRAAEPLGVQPGPRLRADAARRERIPPGHGAARAHR